MIHTPMEGTRFKVETKSAGTDGAHGSPHSAASARGGGRVEVRAGGVHAETNPAAEVVSVLALIAEAAAVVGAVWVKAHGRVYAVAVLQKVAWLALRALAQSLIELQAKNAYGLASSLLNVEAFGTGQAVQLRIYLHAVAVVGFWVWSTVSIEQQKIIVAA